MVVIVILAFLAALFIILGEFLLRSDNVNYQYLGTLDCRVAGMVLFIFSIALAIIASKYISSKSSCILIVVLLVVIGVYGLNEFIKSSNIANILLENYYEYEEEGEEEEEKTLERAENVEVDATENVEVQGEVTNFIVGDSIDYEAFAAYVSREFDEILEEIDSLLEEEESK